MVRFLTLGATELHGSEGDISSLISQPRRLALLAYLALARPSGFVRREVLLALFWPNSDEEHARNALRQAIHFLRRALGEGVIVARGNDEVGIDREQLWCDAVAFEQALSAGNSVEALGIYRGALLPGLHISDATPAFDNWLEDERVRLRRLAADAAHTASAKAEESGNIADAIGWARRAVADSPGAEVAVRSLLSLLDRSGDRAGAARAYRDFEQALASEYDLRPAPETLALLEEIRNRAGATSVIRDAVLPRRSPFHPVIQRSGAGFRLRRSVVAGVAAVLLIVLTVGTWSGVRHLRTSSTPPILAVGEIRDDTQPDSLRESRTVADLLATNLARLPRARVLSRERLWEVLGQLGGKDATGPNLATAARDAGATELLQGVLYHRSASGGGTGGYRLDIRTVDLRTGHVHHAFTAEARELFALVDSATRQFVEVEGGGDWGRGEGDAVRIADVTTSSRTAYRLYEEGIRAYAVGDLGGAERLFVSALSDDSTFAMAAYYAAVVTIAGDYAKGSEYVNRAVRLATHASDREQLLIRAAQAHWLEQPSRLPLARLLAERYPLEPDAHYWLGQAFIATGRFTDAAAPLRRVIALDSLGLRQSGTLCRACNAYSRLAYAYFMLDSLAAAERVIRKWLRAQPRSDGPWYELSHYLADQGRFAEARHAIHIAHVLSPSEYADLDEARLLLQRERYADADTLLRAIVRNDPSWKRTIALWYLAVSLRDQGRLREALDIARQYRQSAMGDERKLDTGGLLEAQVLLESGRPAAAAALFSATAASVRDPHSAARAARHIAWRLTLEACALAAAGDTTRLSRLEDSVQFFAHVSGYGRDRVLHHHVRGLLLVARGQDAQAADEFRKAIYSPNGGFTRTNLELGRMLIRLGRPREAVGVLQPAFQVESDAMALYATRSELHELLARAFDAASVPDSAAAHYHAVLSAWRAPDQQLAARRAAIAARRPNS